MSVIHPACYNRAPYKNHVEVQIGWTEDGRRITAWVEDNMSKGCPQWGLMGEATLHGWNCDGCKWKPEGM